MAQLLIWFVLLFYVPTLLFRFVASLNVDLTQRKIATQIEDFFAAALPSFFLNVVAVLVTNTITLWHLAEISTALPLLLVTEGKIPPAHFNLIAFYYITLIVISAASGWIYGYMEYQLTFYGERIERERAGVFRRAALWYHDFWDAFFRREKVTLFPWRVKPTWLFVRTADRLFHGRLQTWDMSSDGQIAGILLDDVKRVNTYDEALKGSVEFTVPFRGTLWIRWANIIDINTADVGDPKTLRRVEVDFARRLASDRVSKTFRGRLRKLFRK